MNDLKDALVESWKNRALEAEERLEAMEWKYKERGIAMQDTGGVIRELFVPRIKEWRERLEELVKEMEME